MRWVLGIICLLMAAPVAANPVTIDDFTVGPLALADDHSGNMQSHSSIGSSATQTGLNTANVIGGTRVSSITSVSGSLTNVLDATFTIDKPALPPFPDVSESGKAVMSNLVGGETRVDLSYTNGPLDLTIDAFGITGTAASTFIRFDFESSISLQINASATDSDGDIATTTLTTPSSGGVSIDDTDVFSNWSNALAVNFESIENLSFEFIARSGSSFQLNSISLQTTIPEPSSVWLVLGLGCAFAARSRRRREAE